MNDIEMLLKQSGDAYKWIDKLISSVPYEQWDATPDVVESNISWQVGHLIISYYFHSVMVIKGHRSNILQKLPLKEYDKLFIDGAPIAVAGKISPADLHSQLKFISSASLEIISSLRPEELEEMLADTTTPHPVAKNKFEALDWNIKHTMWHCGQIAILKRITNNRFDFELKRQRQ
ncbi:DinB family protein [Mucilaginibacter terrae]|uniref:DinB-like domain-containing protein n=1 Tax=Mucilaginibacter terrae TaxID=1955052 RepID=A0ABU3GVH5_9SPHI|nr:DinB family protein [Mucilaginibacter terrae]MDT3403770.1 hypothetical protein [Mucilaginibacter terrae]